VLSQLERPHVVIEGDHPGGAEPLDFEGIEAVIGANIQHGLVLQVG
jgi:hypothetical protein